MWRIKMWWRGWRYHWRQAHRLVAEVQQGRAHEGNPGMFGSMILAEEREFLTTTPGTRMTIYTDGEVEFSEEPDWREQTAADLSPEALDEEPVIDLGYLSLPAELQQELESSGPGAGSSLAPGPDPSRLSWLDQQLAAHLAWVRRMRSEVTGWALT